MELADIIEFFESNVDEDNLKTMNRLKVGSDKKYGIRMPVLRKFAKEIGKDHELALKLWNHGYHESRLLATLIEESDKVDKAQLEAWVNDFDTWDLCDQACINLLVEMPSAIERIPIWAESEKEFVKRTAFSLIAVIAVHDKTSDDSYFEGFFSLIGKASFDERNFVKKSVNWAIRSIGKKNIHLNQKAIELSNEILEYDSKSARWIAKNALRELESEKVQKKLN
ncbi:DNA alkylation repair protein [Methanobrevibacter millerae]|uniref:3-methyladenine DNA glycosylase AlkD n=1 Tax=Methanobrevibacter millerae TaxID=230361 RepID=A0A1G5WIS4_9EURY|nr:DNA alkylation repair protein [Methanobrevibacter millerae]SDA58091.1 3-methyladenine DNA glycosylase AlkD [Methanobrevibacter millerae]